MNTITGPKKRRSPKSGSAMRNAPSSDALRRCTGCDSSSRKKTRTKQSVANAARKAKIQCHEPYTRSQPPASGARIGAAPITSIMSESTRADWISSKRSRITARISTMPDAPPSACAKRSRTKCSMVPASTQVAEASVNTASPPRSGSLRP